MLISIIVPCYNEEGNLPELHRRISAVMASVATPYELLFVDDGSSDNSSFVLRQLHESDQRVTVLELSRNFGHQAAVCAGIDHARGDAVVMLDADLQHPPEKIAELIERWREGYEVVCTVRKDPETLPKFKKFTSWLFYRLINALSSTSVAENSADFRLMDRKVVEQFRNLRESNKFLRGLVGWVGFRQCSITYDAGPRHCGATKYSFLKMLKLAFDGITSFSAFPLHVSTALGVCVSVFSFFYAVYAVYIRLFTHQALPGWASVLVAVLFLGGVQLLSLGVIGEYLNRIYTETKGRPPYIVRNTHGGSPRQ
jgi:polyisoprenyl-phosphate glycosyltransferase